MLEPKVGDKYKCLVDNRVCPKNMIMTVTEVGSGYAPDSVKVTYKVGDNIGAWLFTAFPEAFELVSEYQKPPLGLRPWHIADAERVVEILDAMKRYTAECKPIPEQWMEELIDKTVIHYEQ